MNLAETIRRVLAVPECLGPPHDFLTAYLAGDCGASDIAAARLWFVEGGRFDIGEDHAMTAIAYACLACLADDSGQDVTRNFGISEVERRLTILAQDPDRDTVPIMDGVQDLDFGATA